MIHSDTRPGAVVRLATIDEAEAIAAVLRESFAEFETLYTPDAFTATTPGPEKIRARWHEGPVWVAVVDDRIAGTVAAVSSHHDLYVRSMGVRPEARGRALGTLLLEHVERFARQQGFRRLNLSATPFLRTAIRMYEAFGFRRTSSLLDTLHGTPLVMMEKSLDVDTPPPRSAP